MFGVIAILPGLVSLSLWARDRRGEETLHRSVALSLVVPNEPICNVLFQIAHDIGKRILGATL